MDRGAVWTASARFEVALEKNLVGGAGSTIPYRSFGTGASQAAAETQALADLNGKWQLRYNGAKDSFGVTLVADVN